MSTLSDYRDRPHWSFSAISQFFNCGLQFAFDRVYKLPRQFTSVALPFGNTWHRVCEHIFWKLKDGVKTDVGEAHDLFSELWDRQTEAEETLRFKEGEDAETLRAAARPMLDALISGLNDADTSIVTGINVAFAAPLYDADGVALDKPFIGEIDATVEKAGQPIVIDWKTSAKKWSARQAENHLQATVFCHAHRMLTGKEALFRFDVVTKTKTPAFCSYVTERTADDAVRLAEKVKVAEQMIESEAFLPNEASFFCDGCGHAEACREWHRKKATLATVAA